MQSPSDRGFSRRSFLKGSAIAGIATSGLPAAAPPREPKTYAPGQHEIVLQVNGAERTVAVDPRTTLLEALRDGLDLTGTKQICDRGSCGGCTVLLDGEPVNSCLLLALDAVGAPVTTIERLGEGPTPHPLLRSFVQCDALQCGYCTPGMVMSSFACLRRHQKPTRAQIRADLSGNLCRCGTYGRIFDAVERTAEGGGR